MYIYIYIHIYIHIYYILYIVYINMPTLLIYYQSIENHEISDAFGCGNAHFGAFF